MGGVGPGVVYGDVEEARGKGGGGRSRYGSGGGGPGCVVSRRSVLAVLWRLGVLSTVFSLCGAWTDGGVSIRAWSPVIGARSQEKTTTTATATTARTRTGREKADGGLGACRR